MAYTSHGYLIPGTNQGDGKPPLQFRCGGPNRGCLQCRSDIGVHFGKKATFDEGNFKNTFPSMNGAIDIPSRARQAVVAYFNDRLEKGETATKFPLKESEVYVVWFTFTLGSWKAMLSTEVPDGMYYELTYNGEKKELYFDAYKKIDNVVMRAPRD